MREENIVSYTAEELDAKNSGKIKSDLDRVRAMTEEELEELIANDPDEAGLEWDADSTIWVNPQTGTITIPSTSTRFHDAIQRFIQKYRREGYEDHLIKALEQYEIEEPAR